MEPIGWIAATAGVVLLWWLGHVAIQARENRADRLRRELDEL